MGIEILGKYKVIVASIHAQSTSELEVRIENVEKLLYHLDTLGRKLDYSAVVVGADFNVDAAATLNQEQRYGFTIPSYSPTVHRAFHANEFMCIDFFAYKNYGSDNIRVQNVRSHMIIKSPQIIKANDTEEEYHVDLEVYGDPKGYQEIRKAEMNHDPLHGELVFGAPVTPPTDESRETKIFSSAKKEPQAISITRETTPQLTPDITKRRQTSSGIKTQQISSQSGTKGKPKKTKTSPSDDELEDTENDVIIKGSTKEASSGSKARKQKLKKPKGSLTPPDNYPGLADVQKNFQLIGLLDED